jgi:predicted Ser/Thr protein kinase
LLISTDNRGIYLEPNKYARPAEIEIHEDYVVFHGYQEYTLTKNTLTVSAIDLGLKKKQQLMASYFSPRYLAQRSFLDLGANAGFHSFWALQEGAKNAIAIDIDEKYLQMMREAKFKLGFNNLEIVNANIIDWNGSADIVIALSLIHWVYSCTALYGSLNAAISKLRQLVTYMMIIEWVAKEDPAINFFHHLDWNKEIIRNDYNQENFEAALRENFSRIEVLGDISQTRRLYVAYCRPDEVDLSGPLPFIADKDSIKSSRCLSKLEGIEYWSIIYDIGDKIIKQATLDLAEREKHFLSQLDSEYFPKILDSWSEENYSVIIIEKIKGEKLKSSSQEIANSFERLHLFIQSCLDILDILEKKGIMHRDIRPDNIIIRNYRPVLIDFGWAISEEIPYITPPCLGGTGRPDDGNFCDVYSMGKILKYVNSSKYTIIDGVIDLMIDPNPMQRFTEIPTLKLLFELASQIEINSRSI